MTDPNSMKDSKSKSDKPYIVHFLKSNSFKVIHADGAHGGISPKGLLNMSVFSERLPIPKKEIFKEEDGVLKHFDRVGKEDLVREVEATILMDYPTMVMIRDWMTGQIKEFEKRYKIKPIPGDIK